MDKYSKEVQDAARGVYERFELSAHRDPLIADMVAEWTELSEDMQGRWCEAIAPLVGLDEKGDT